MVWRFLSREKELQPMINQSIFNLYINQNKTKQATWIVNREWNCMEWCSIEVKACIAWHTQQNKDGKYLSNTQIVW